MLKSMCGKFVKWELKLTHKCVQTLRSKGVNFMCGKFVRRYSKFCCSIVDFLGVQKRILFVIRNIPLALFFSFFFSIFVLSFFLFPRSFSSFFRFCSFFLVACTRLYTPLCPSVGRLVRHILLFLGFCGLWPHCSCPNDLVSSITAPAHPNATGIAVYPALFGIALNPFRW